MLLYTNLHASTSQQKQSGGMSMKSSSCGARKATTALPSWPPNVQQASKTACLAQGVQHCTPAACIVTGQVEHAHLQTACAAINYIKYGQQPGVHIHTFQRASNTCSQATLSDNGLCTTSSPPYIKASLDVVHTGIDYSTAMRLPHQAEQKLSNQHSARGFKLLLVAK